MELDTRPYAQKTFSVVRKKYPALRKKNNA